MMRRRDFITLLGSAAAAWPLVARAQQPIPVIGVCNGGSMAEWADRIAGFRLGLGEMGFVEGHNVALEHRWAEGQLERVPELVADLITRKVAVMLVGGNTAVKAAIAATKTIPIVFTTTSDPVAVGFVANLNRPGGNVTGATFIGAELLPKRVELLHELIPNASKIALLVNPNNPVTEQEAIEGMDAAARRLGAEIIILNASNDVEIEAAFTAAVRQRAAALISTDGYFDTRRDQMAALGLRHSLPTISGVRDSVLNGMLMSYGASIRDTYRQAGIYVGRILKGEKPADLPVMRPTKIELILNLKTAKALGLTVPPSLLARADEVIE